MKWHGLLVSVRSDGEAIEAIAGGATIIDVKEPLHGSLGCASPDVIARVAGVVGQDRPWTMACGELRDGPCAMRDAYSSARRIGMRCFVRM